MSRVSVAAVALALACQGDDWVIAGERPVEMDLPNDAREVPGVASDAGACLSSFAVLAERAKAFGAPSVVADHVGRWRGELAGDAAVGFPGREVELRVDASGAGTLFFSASTSDRFVAADDGYLCNADASRVVCGSASGFVGGFSYSIDGARSRARVLSFAIVTADPWGSWCAEREPVSWEDATQACGLAFGVLPDAVPRWSAFGCTRVSQAGAQPIDCASMYALDHCQCASDACFARFDRSVQVGLLLSEDGTLLSGSLWYENQVDASPIELTRSP